MAFEKKTWTDRITEFPTRRTLTKSDGSTELVTVARAEGTVSQEGDAFNAANMNNLETRIGNEFGKINNSLIDIYVGDDGKLHKVQGGADTVLPFSGNRVAFFATLSTIYPPNVNFVYTDGIYCDHEITDIGGKGIKFNIKKNCSLSIAIGFTYSVGSKNRRVLKNGDGVLGNTNNMPGYDSISVNAGDCLEPHWYYGGTNNVMKNGFIFGFINE